jgi:hypothetical protein
MSVCKARIVATSWDDGVQYPAVWYNTNVKRLVSQACEGTLTEALIGR